MLEFMKEKGQGLVEYSLIIALIAVLIIAALALIAPALSGVFSQIASELAI